MFEDMIENPKIFNDDQELSKYIFGEVFAGIIKRLTKEKSNDDEVSDPVF